MKDKEQIEKLRKQVANLKEEIRSLWDEKIWLSRFMLRYDMQYEHGSVEVIFKKTPEHPTGAYFACLYIVNGGYLERAFDTFAEARSEAIDMILFHDNPADFESETEEQQQ
ncbi:hypothetical protein D6827_03470 [Candidatus Parcubacteria bacterium]|nr:MAG: hypothetical protein D6827_03470 [Candidatus Parcubacteria bacterium]